MKLEVGKAANDGFAACGHPVREGQDVLRIEHDGIVAMVCLKRHCAGPFYEHDEKLEELRTLNPQDHAALVAAAEGAATEAARKAAVAWDHVDKKVDEAQEDVDVTRVAVDLERAFAASKLPPGAEVDRDNLSRSHETAERLHTDALRELHRRTVFRDFHHSRSRTVAFEAACAWLHAVRSA